MTVKNINDVTWAKVEKEIVKAVLVTKRGVKDSEILRLLIEKGIENIKEDDYKKLIRK